MDGTGVDGTLHVVDGRPMLRFERRLPHPVTKVWRAITDPAELSGWFPWHVAMDFRTGGKISFTHPAGAVTAPDAVITELDAPHAFAYRWNDEDLRWELTPDGDACVLVFTHVFRERPGAAKFAAGWHLSLDALGAVLTGSPVVKGGWQELNTAYVRAFGLLDGEIDGDRLRFEQELVYPEAVVREALLAALPSGSLEYSRDGYQVRFDIVPQDFGVRVVLTVSADSADRLPPVRAAWREWLETFAAGLDARG